MRNKIKDKFQIIFWNLVFILLGLMLVGLIHAYLSQMAILGMEEANLIENVKQDMDFQRRGATRITKSGREIVSDYSLSSESIMKKAESQFNGFLLAILVIILPFFLGVVYILYINISQLAVNRQLSLFITSFIGTVGIFSYEFHQFYISGNVIEFVVSLPTIILILFFWLYASLNPNERIRPYYRSKTELDESLLLAA